tara:strand:- start:3620 stop:3940 length:321 start_codon:yes stop_codon:yes gene_type:complete
MISEHFKRRHLKMKFAVLALLFALPISSLANTETQDEVIEEVVVIAKRIPATLEDKKELILEVRRACDKEFFDGIYRNTVWINGHRPASYCQALAIAAAKKTFPDV